MGRRDIIIIAVVVVIATALAVWGTGWLVVNILEDPNDPLARQGGLKPLQDIHRALPAVAPPSRE